MTAAGIALDKPFVEHTWEEVSRVQDINVRGKKKQIHVFLLWKIQFLLILYR